MSRDELERYVWRKAGFQECPRCGEYFQVLEAGACWCPTCAAADEQRDRERLARATLVPVERRAA